MTRCLEEFGIKICDKEFITSVGDFPQIETTELSRLTINDMHREFIQEISAQMGDMLENWHMPMERILSWFPTSRRTKSYGMWFKEWATNDILKLRELYNEYDLIRVELGAR